MGAFNELYHAFERVAEKSNQPIYNDVADAGYSYNTNNVPEDVQVLFEEITDLKKYPEHVIKRETYGKNGVFILLHVPIEYDEGYEVGYDAVNFWKLSKTGKHSQFNKEHNAYVHVDIGRYKMQLKK